MTDNNCLRAACLSDVTVWSATAEIHGNTVTVKLGSRELTRLYDAEWALRGYKRAP